jgi:SAM-dependent methyltransferase
VRQDVISLERFYASPLGRAASGILRGKLTDLWDDARGLDILGLGYALPMLDAFGTAPKRLIGAIPHEHGPSRWDPSGRGNATLMVGDLRLPFADGQFDRIIVLHGLEETSDPRAYLRELWRITAPEGRVVIAATNRLGLWARATQTPFGQGRPWTRGQLIHLLSSGLFQVTASSSALYMPPVRWPIVSSAAEGWEVLGRTLTPGLGGVVMVEAVKRLTIPARGGNQAPVTERRRAYRPAAASTAGNPEREAD